MGSIKNYIKRIVSEDFVAKQELKQNEKVIATAINELNDKMTKTN